MTMHFQQKIFRKIVLALALFVLATPSFSACTSSCLFKIYMLGIQGASTTTSAPTSDPYYSNVTLLLANGQSTVTDVMGHTLTTSGSVSMSTATQLFGHPTISMASGGLISLTANALAGTSGTEDFTIEMWVNSSTAVPQTLTNSTPTLIDTRPSQTSVAGIIAEANGYVQQGTSTAPGSVLLSGNTSMSAGTWYFVVIQRQSGTLTYYLNGVAEQTGTDSNALTSTVYRLGYNIYPANGYFSGYFGPIRITTGVARYSGNFTPPTSDFPESN